MVKLICFRHQIARDLSLLCAAEASARSEASCRLRRKDANACMRMLAVPQFAAAVQTDARRESLCRSGGYGSLPEANLWAFVAADGVLFGRHRFMRKCHHDSPVRLTVSFCAVFLEGLGELYRFASPMKKRSSGERVSPASRQVLGCGASVHMSM